MKDKVVIAVMLVVFMLLLMTIGVLFYGAARCDRQQAGGQKRRR